MRHLLLGVAVVGIAWTLPAKAFPLAMPGVDSPNVETALVAKVGWRRQHWRYGYPLPYAYYSPGYGYYAPPRPYAYYPPARSYYVPVPSSGGYPLDTGEYADYPPAEGDYPAGDYADGPPPGGY